MPFLAPVAAWVGSVITGISAWAAASPILAGLAQTAFGIAAKYAASRLSAKKPKATSTRLETEYGSDLARFVGMGIYAYAGTHVFRNTYGQGNRNVQDVYVLSHFRITEVTRVRVNGEWVTVADKFLDPNLGYRLNSRVYMKVYTGTMGQAADAFLISQSQGQWTTNHRGAGVAYAIVTTFLNRESQFTSPVQPLFEVKGAPLYDWRKDSTVGGSGSHRWDNQNTWEFTENGVQMMYALERGIFNGTQKMVGKGVPASKLPLSEWSLAANIADELVTPVGGGPQVKKYRAAIMAQSGSNATHDSNLQPLLESMAGSWVERVDGEYPIAGAERLIAFTITDGDLVKEVGYRVSMKLPRSELINTVSIRFPSPDSFYENIPGTTRVDTAALAEDGEQLASAITYESVIYSEQVDRLADIAIRAARYQGNGEITILPKYLELAKPGAWFRWNSAMYGVVDWQIVSVTLGPLSDRGARNIRLGIREISAGVFDRTAYINDPPGPPVYGTPSYLAEVQNPGETPNLIQSATGTTLPGVIVRWDAITDVTVTEVEISYRPVGQPTKIFRKIVKADVSTVQLSEGLTSLTNWQWQTLLITSPQRTVAASAWRNFTTLNGLSNDFYPVDINKLAADVQGYFAWMGKAEREIWRQLEEIGTHFADQELNNYQERREILVTLSARTNDIEANYKQEILVATGPNSSLARAITEINAVIPGIAANASATSLLTTRVDRAENNISVVSAQVNSLSSSLGQFATATAVQGLQTRVDTVDGGVSVNALAITALTTTVAGKADASALSSLETRVTTAEGNISANSTAITSLTASYNNVSANATFQMQAFAAPSGWTARIGMVARVNTSDSFKQGGLFIDTTTSLARVAVIADQFVISTSGTFLQPFLFSGTTAYLQNVNIENAIIGNLQVGTSNIVPGAVNRVGYDNNNATMTVPGSNAYGTASTVTINHGANSPPVFVSAALTGAGSGGFRSSAANGNSRVRLFNVTENYTMSEIIWFEAGNSYGPAGDAGWSHSFNFIPNPATTSTQIVMQVAQSGPTNGNYGVKNRSMTVLTFLRS